LETFAGCSSIVRRHVERLTDAAKVRLRGADVGSGTESEAVATVEDDGEVEAHTAEADRVVVAPPPTKMKTSALGDDRRRIRCCTFGIPLSVSAICVVVLDLGESLVMSGFLFFRVGWMNAFLCGVIFKLALLSMCIKLAEGILLSGFFGRVGTMRCIGLPIQLWVRAHRMSRDILVSTLIIVCLAPLVLLNALNNACCPNCSVHHLLVYRDPGHTKRMEILVNDEDDAEDGSLV